MARVPYSREELDARKRQLRARIESTERENPELRPLPPMSEPEAREMLQAFFDTAVSRALTREESCFMGQLLACYRMAVEAEMLGRKGRYFVMSEAHFNRLINRP